MHESVQCITLSQGASKWSHLIALLEGSHFQQKISRNCSLEALTNSVMLISRLCLWKSKWLVSSPLTLAHFPSCPLQDLERSSTVSPTQTLSIRTSFSGSEVSFGGPSWCFGRGGTQQYSATRRAPARGWPRTSQWHLCSSPVGFYLLPVHKVMLRCCPTCQPRKPSSIQGPD